MTAGRETPDPWQGQPAIPIKRGGVFDAGRETTPDHDFLSRPFYGDQCAVKGCGRPHQEHTESGVCTCSGDIHYRSDHD